MRNVLKACVCLSFLMLAACSKPRQIAVNGAPLHEPSKTAILQEGSLFFRGLDGKHLDLPIRRILMTMSFMFSQAASMSSMP